MQRLPANPDDAARWLRTRVRGALHADSRRVRAGDGFIAWPGAATDGRRHVASALAQGAAACLVEDDGVEPFNFTQPAIASYAGLKASTGPIAAAYYGHPSRLLDVLAITGTNGKTSTAWWLSQALSKSELLTPAKCGLVGTLGIGIAPNVVFNGLTTPDPVLLQHHLRKFVDEGVTACAVEASSVGIAERRLDGTQVRLAVLTNFTQDHLDYHGTMQAYWDAKAALFQWPGLRAAVINIDDPKGAQLARSLAGSKAPGLAVWTFSCTQPATLQARDIAYGEAGLQFTVQEGVESHGLFTPLVGQYNVSNLLGVLTAMRALGVPLARAVKACEGLLPVPGRMERLVAPGKPLVAVDYAHTPDALDQALRALQPLARQRAGQLWCVFGCGGERDPHKRPLMLQAARGGANQVVVTSDNPRSEQPLAIIDQILGSGPVPAGVQVQADRARAIAMAVASAAAADVILLAGKGHEDYQDIAGVKHPFDDRTHARAALDARSAS